MPPIRVPRIAVALASLTGCSPGTPGDRSPAAGADTGSPAPPSNVATHSVAQVTVRDIALATNFQGILDGRLQHGRALVAADFDLDGRVDVYLGNPGDTSYVMRNTAGPDGLPRFELVQRLEENELAWGAAPLDYDNDGDIDLFVTNGGNEGIGFGRLFRNEQIETGDLSFTDVTDQAGVAGPVPPGDDAPIPIAAGNAAVVDFDRDGDEDIFVSVNIVGADSFSVDACSSDAGEPSLPELLGRNLLWRNNGDGTFTDATDEVGLGKSRFATRNSSWLDLDGDGDHDLFVNNVNDPGELFLNQLAETGVATFVPGNDALRAAGADFGFPLSAPASAADDFDQDGRTDLAVFSKASGATVEPGSPYPAGHALFTSDADGHWHNQAPASGLLDLFESMRPGVMGCQVGDLDMDGRPDVYVGNGGVAAGTVDALFISSGQPGDPIAFRNATVLTDFPAPQAAGVQYGPYPYRTHGTVIVDVDGDGRNELLVLQGGPAVEPSAREPNRLFQFDWGVEPPPTVRVRLVGDGRTVPMDAIGSRVDVRTSGTLPRDVYRTVSVGHGFSAHALFDMALALPDAEGIESLTVRWTDGVEETFTDPVPLGSRVTVTRGSGVVVDPADASDGPTND